PSAATVPPTSVAGPNDEPSARFAVVVPVVLAASSGYQATSPSSVGPPTSAAAGAATAAASVETASAPTSPAASAGRARCVRSMCSSPRRDEGRAREAEPAVAGESSGSPPPRPAARRRGRQPQACAANPTSYVVVTGAPSSTAVPVTVAVPAGTESARVANDWYALAPGATPVTVLVP